MPYTYRSIISEIEGGKNGLKRYKILDKKRQYSKPLWEISIHLTTDKVHLKKPLK